MLFQRNNLKMPEKAFHKHQISKKKLSEGMSPHHLAGSVPPLLGSDCPPCCYQILGQPSKFWIYQSSTTSERPNHQGMFTQTNFAGVFAAVSSLTSSISNHLLSTVILTCRLLIFLQFASFPQSENIVVQLVMNLLNELWLQVQGWHTLEIESKNKVTGFVNLKTVLTTKNSFRFWVHV